MEALSAPDEVLMPQAVVVDIGTGSVHISEVCEVHDGRFRPGVSLRLGGLVLTERCTERNGAGPLALSSPH
jgi:exopolyphosphatase/pppGpp-phosphohydrolase